MRTFRIPGTRWVPLLVLPLMLAVTPATATSAGRRLTGDVSGVVTDSATGGPLSGVQIIIRHGLETVARANTDMLGRFTVHNLSSNEYDVEVRQIGYHPAIQHVTVSPGGADITLTFRLTEAPFEIEAVQVVSTPIAVNTRTGDQVFKQD